MSAGLRRATVFLHVSRTIVLNQKTLTYTLTQLEREICEFFFFLSGGANTIIKYSLVVALRLVPKRSTSQIYVNEDQMLL